jgi:hypothetical protein
MNKYKITASSLSYYTLEIEAESEDEAFALGKEADGGSFKPDGLGDWVITNVELVPHIEGCPFVDGFGCRCGASPDESYKAIDKMLETKRLDETT